MIFRAGLRGLSNLYNRPITTLSTRTFSSDKPPQPPTERSQPPTERSRPSEPVGMSSELEQHHRQTEIDKFREELEEEKKRETKSGVNMPGLFYASMAGLVFIMYYVQYMFYMPQDTKKKRVKIMGEAKIGGAWSLVNGKGKITTDQDYRGKFIVYYFGFCKCPDICPASLQKLGSAIDLLNKKGKGEELAFLFVSLDPDRDTPELVERYTKAFHPQIDGLIVPNEMMGTFTKNYKIYAKKMEGETQDDYNIDHTSYMYIFDKEGKFMNVLGANLNFAELAESIEDHMALLS